MVFNGEQKVHPRTLAFPLALAVAAVGAALLARPVYLDVWNREVSATEDPGLREPALDSASHGTRLWSVLAVAVLGALAVVTMKSTAPLLALRSSILRSRPDSNRRSRP